MSTGTIKFAIFVIVFLSIYGNDMGWGQAFAVAALLLLSFRVVDWLAKYIESDDDD